MSNPPSSALSEGILERIRAEYAEMPGLRVTRQQAQRLWGLEEDACVAALDHLMQIGFLCRTFSGLYARRTDSPAIVPPARMANATRLRRGADRLAV